MMEPENSTNILQSVLDALEAGEAEVARTRVLDLLQRRPECIDAYVLLARIERANGRLEQATAALQRAASIDPDRADLWSSLGELYGLRANWREAAIAYGRAAMQENAPEHLAAQAMAQLAAQQHDSAFATSRDLSSRFPHAPSAMLVESHVHKTRGEFGSAISTYEQVLAADPRCATALFNIVDLRTPPVSDKLTRHVQELSQDESLDDASRADLEFALATIFDRSSHFDQAFEHYRKANCALQNRMRNLGLIYDPTAAESRLEAEVSRYGPRAMQRVLEPLPIALRPIFIVGMPRSGTSLVEQILSCHPQVAAGGELTAAQLCYATYVVERERLGLRGAVDSSNDLELNLLRRARERYVEFLFEAGLDAATVTDKFPGNFTILGFLRGMFPDAVIVHTTREPMATCWSLYTANLSAHAPYKTSLETLGHYYRLYLQIMHYWRDFLGNSLCEISYESLVSDPDTQIRQLLDACDLPWDMRCLDFQASQRAVTTASLLQIRKPIFKSSLDRWLPYAGHLGPLRASLGFGG